MSSIPSGASGADSTTRAYDGRPSADEAAKRSVSPSVAVDRIATGAHQAVDRIAAAATSAADRLSIKGDDLVAARDHWTQACSSYVKENPLTALGIAAAVGFVLSRWVR